MNVSVIIPVVNEYHALCKLIPELVKTNARHTLDILVCDGGSSDLSCAYIRQWQQHDARIRLVECALGRAQQMNAGALQAKYDCMIFLHADTQLPEQWVDLIVGKAWGRFNVQLSGRHFMFRVIETMMNWRSCLTQVATGDQAIFVSKKLFYKVQAYPDIPLMEDIALSKKLRQHSRMHCIKTPLVTSSRRWEQYGVWRTIALMWRLRFAYFRGVSPQQLAKKYYPHYAQKRLEAIVQVFAKVPVSGYVKTRLIPHIGAQAATDIHRFLLQHSLTLVQQSTLDSELWLAQENTSTLTHNEHFLTPVLKAQQGNNLGDRMAFAIQQGLRRHKKVILIGTDCLDLTTEHLTRSLVALDKVDVVLTPVADGGFISIACRVFDVRMFEQVAWGCATALADVLNNLQALSLSYTLLKPVRDIDTYADVLNYPQLLDMIKT